MTAEELELIALKKGCRVPRVMPRKKREGHVVHVVLFNGPKGRCEAEVALDASAEDATKALSAALVG